MVIEAVTTSISQVPPAATDPPEKLIPLAPAVLVTVPPQVLTAGSGVATIAAGMMSVKAKPVAATADAELSIVNVSVGC